MERGANWGLVENQGPIWPVAHSVSKPISPLTGTTINLVAKEAQVYGSGYARCYILKEGLFTVTQTYSNYLLDSSTVIFSPYVRLCIHRGRRTKKTVGEFR